MRNRIIRYAIIATTCIAISFIIRKSIIYYIFKSEDEIRIARIKEIPINGVVEGNIYNGDKEGYDYYITSNTFVFGKYFFENNNQINLEIGDSVSKVPNELVLKIFRKDESGQYKYIGTSK